jgi:hypothetical protein
MNTQQSMNITERRLSRRDAWIRPCKVLDTRSGRWHAGETRDASGGGLLIELAWETGLRPGDSVHICVALSERDLLREAEGVEARVVRTMAGARPFIALAYTVSSTRALAA